MSDVSISGAVHVVATGGTISSHLGPDGWTNLDGAALVTELGDLPVAVEVHDVAAGPSSNLSTDDMVAIARRVQRCIADGAVGVVVTHGTDTIELTSFVTQLLTGTSPDRVPVVFTGSMRVHSHADPDGPQNMRDAIGVAAHPQAVGREVLVCVDGELHAADRVRKVDATSIDAFTSAPFEPVGRVVGGVPVFTAPRPTRREPATSLLGGVPLVTCFPGITADDLEHWVSDAPGAVVEGFGDLNVPQALWGPIHRAAQRGALVVLASRPYTNTATGEGLSLLGAIGSGGLTAQRARLAVMAALGTCTDRDAAAEWVLGHRLHHDAGPRSSTA